MSARDAIPAPPAGPEPPPLAARELCGDALPVLERYAELLASAGVQRGLIGPREVGRIWERHLLNCAAVAPLIPNAATVADIGSGAGLPGLVLALVRPDLHVILVESMLRRTGFLEECRAQLDRPDITVRRARAEELAGELRVDVVTARAVAALPRLAALALPLLRPGGVLLALKGERAGEEVATWAEQGLPAGVQAEVVTCGTGVLEQPTTVVRVARTARSCPRSRVGDTGA